MLKKKEVTFFKLDNIINTQNDMNNMEEKKRKINETEKKNIEEVSINNVTLKNFNNIHNSYSQITEMKNKHGILPLTMSDLKINIGDDKNLKVEEFMTNFISNVFESKNALYLYCKYVLLFYGKDLIDEKNIDSLNFEIIKGGITNILVKVEDNLQKKKYLIRLYGPKTSEIINREREKKISSILCEVNISKKIYVFFPNGRIEEFMDGYALSKEDIKDKEFQKEIAKKLRLLHDISLNDSLFKQLQNLQNIESNESSFLWHTIWKYFNLLNEERKSNYTFSSKKNILNLIDFNMLKLTIKEVEKLCSQKKSPIVLCHCDLLSSNIINGIDGSISFIDFEYSCPMERAFDIANHFNEYAGFNCEWNLIPSRNEEYHFIKHYLKTDDENLIYKLIDEIQPFYLSSHIIWGLWALLQAMHSTIDFDFINYAIHRLSAAYSPIFRCKIDTNI
ncbi:ethanolamine kinase, putative [Plasmodium gallinaceum]|uniref:ethanolamine kinase n=1 Tax=Plasmodium gallinaceum TaxID=5849 RepID=A0A1J1GVL5_PLAGA|nr:ethanolamine kinase, putative [Plasmodium gallinaceum]CRG96294.1 ethanolamine kinase, putative [Plasmodium gallinaceum]